MKRIFFLLSGFFIGFVAIAQDAESAKPGVVYGVVTEKGITPISVNDLEQKIGDAKYEGQIKGKVVEVCKAMGCWAKIERADGSTVMIKVKDHEFAMPLDIVGQTILAEGTAELKQTSVSMLKHYAEDAGKSKEEIEKIKEPKKEVLINLKGVKVVE
jgi:disulfide oxidoreductase YuzD